MRLLENVSSVVGRSLAAGTRVLALRPAAKPLHPQGCVARATLVRRGSSPPSGVAWLDQGGTDEVLVRYSRSAGLPPPLPDVFGLALRVPVAGGGHGDLLLASTGRGRLTRFLLTPRLGADRPYGTLLPYRTPAGPVVITAVPVPVSSSIGPTIGATGWPTGLELSWAVGSGPWRPFAELRLPGSPTDDSDAPDEPVSFDAVLHTIPGLETYHSVRRLREPSYRAARRSRSPI